MSNAPQTLRRTALILCAAFVVSAFLPLSAPAQESDVPRVVQVVVRTLQLEEAQVQQWAEVRANTAAAVEPLAAEVETLQGQLEEVLAGEDPDPAAVGALVLAIRTLRGEIRSLGAAATAEFEALLTEDQAGRLNAVRRAARLQRVLPAFRALRLL